LSTPDLLATFFVTLWDIRVRKVFHAFSCKYLGKLDLKLEIYILVNTSLLVES
jgi:hypothetical protein